VAHRLELVEMEVLELEVLQEEVQVDQEIHHQFHHHKVMMAVMEEIHQQVLEAAVAEALLQLDKMEELRHLQQYKKVVMVALARLIP
jgi:cell fate regulator YaaT (PSP1 superfamily)